MSYQKSISIKDDLEKEVQKVQKDLGLRILIPLVIQTPVDTGRAKLNWLVTQKNSTDSTKDEPKNSSTTQQTAIMAGTAEINKTAAYTKTFIQNNLVYIEYLNEGSSKQAPSKYVDAIIAKAVADNV